MVSVLPSSYGCTWKLLSTRDAAKVALGYRLVRFISFSRA